METQPNSLNDLRMFITPQRIMPLWIIQIGLLTGPIIFAIVIYFIHLSQADYPPLPQTGMIDLMITLTLADGCIAMLCYFLVFLTRRFPKMFSKISQPPNLSSFDKDANFDSNPVWMFMMKLRVIMLVRLALFEAPAIFGLVVCLIGVQTGSIYQQSDFIINAIPSVFLIFYVLATFPTRERVISQLKQIIESA